MTTARKAGWFMDLTKALTRIIGGSKIAEAREIRRQADEKHAEVEKRLRKVERESEDVTLEIDSFVGSGKDRG